jgi:Cysteine-rich secretory protein family
MRYHNTFRAWHCVPPASYSSDLAREAQDWASTCNRFHSGVANRGENLYWGPLMTNLDTWDAALNWWYSENQNYHYDAPGFSPATGHFTQMIWASTTQIGCGRAVCDWPELVPELGGSGRFGYWVCRYYPQGNIINPGYFAANVPPRCVGW